MNKNRFLVYYDKDTKDIVTTIPREWSRLYKKRFPKYKFKDSKDSASDSEIERYLKTN